MSERLRSKLKDREGVMKLIRFGEAGNEKPGVCINQEYFDVSGFVKDYDETFFATDGVASLATIIEQNKIAFESLSTLDKLRSFVNP